MVIKAKPKVETPRKNPGIKQQLVQREAELVIINSVQEGLASSLDIQSIYTLVGNKIREKFDADTTFIVFRNEERNLLWVPYYADRTLQRSFSRPYGAGVAEAIIDSGKPLLLENAREQQRYGAHHVSSPGAVEDLNQSVLGVPIFRAGKACGAVSVQSYKIKAFDENDLRLLQTLTNSMSLALENARLFDATQQSNAELQIINSVQKGLASRLEMQEIYELVGEKIRETFNAQVVNIATYDRLSQLMHGRYYFEEGRQQPGVTLPLFGFRKWVVENCKPLVISKEMSRRMEEYENPVVHGLQPKSAVFIPMLVGEEATGVISLQNNDQENAFTEADVRLLTTLSGSMSVALENARLFGETQRLLKETEQRNAELAVINSVQAGLASQLEIQGIYELVGDKIREIFDANTVALATFDLQKGLMHRRYIIERGKRYYFDPTPIPTVWVRFIQQGQSILLQEDFMQVMRRIDPTYNVPVGKVPKSVLSVPLQSQGETRGVISLQNVDRENAFSESDMRLLETLANGMSVALENARLWEQEKLYRKALERELEIGREIQTGFLPEELPAVEGWEIAASLLPAREVAGDFYDAFELPDGNIGLVIADVCDKGVGAALFMTLFRSLIRITANQDYFEHTENSGTAFFPAEHLQRAIMLTNNYIAETHHASGMFATLFFGILDPHTGSLIYINGGHEPPLIVRAGEAPESLRKTGPAVGAIPGCRFGVQIVQLDPGELLFAFTDGVPEAKDPRDEFFGHDRLFHILRQGSRSSRELVRTIEAELREYMDGTTQFDDITMLAVKRVH